MKRQTQSTAVFPKRDALVRREFLSSSQIPYTAHLSEHVIRTKAGDYVQVFKISGASFESADDEQLNNWHERLAIALRNSLNPTGEPTPERYRLQTTLSTSLTNLGIESQGLASLGKLDVYATYHLIDTKKQKTLLVNTVHVANTFNLNPNQYSTVVGEDDAAVRSAAELNQEIVTRLALFMERRLAEQPPAPS